MVIVVNVAERRRHVCRYVMMVRMLAQYDAEIEFIAIDIEPRIKESVARFVLTAATCTCWTTELVGDDGCSGAGADSGGSRS